jgi:hypothetical protein
MWRYFTAKKTMRYVDMLPDLVYSYNNSQHRSIKTKPALVNAENEDDVFHTLYGRVFDNVQPVKYKFKIGDLVRISKIKRKFEKGYLPNFSKEIFTVKHYLEIHQYISLKIMTVKSSREHFMTKNFKKLLNMMTYMKSRKLLKNEERGKMYSIM